MEHLEIKNALDNVRRNSHRVKNAGNLSLFKKGKLIASKIRRTKNVYLARQHESEYLDLVKHEYSSVMPIGISHSHHFLNMADAYGTSDGNSFDVAAAVQEL